MLQDEKAINQKISRDVSLDQARELVPQQQTLHETRVACFHLGVLSKNPFVPLAVSEIVSMAHETHGPVIAVFENIDWYWMSQLSAELHIDAAFFREHKRNPTEENIWRAAFSNSGKGQRTFVEQDNIAEANRFWHVDGVFEWKPAKPINGEVRPEVKDPNVPKRRREPIPDSKHGWQQWNTCISYCEVMDKNIRSYPNSKHPATALQLITC